MVNIRLQRYGIFLNNQTFLGLFSKLNWLKIGGTGHWFLCEKINHLSPRSISKAKTRRNGSQRWLPFPILILGEKINRLSPRSLNTYSIFTPFYEYCKTINTYNDNRNYLFLTARYLLAKGHRVRKNNNSQSNKGTVNEFNHD